MFVVYLETKVQAISLISVVGEAHNGRQETLEQRDSEREKREVVLVHAICGVVAIYSLQTALCTLTPEVGIDTCK